VAGSPHPGPGTGNRGQAALFQRQRLLVKNAQDFIRLGMSRLYADSQRPDRPRDQNFA